jgi:hypothetical protein
VVQRFALELPDCIFLCCWLCRLHLVCPGTTYYLLVFASLTVFASAVDCVVCTTYALCRCLVALTVSSAPCLHYHDLRTLCCCLGRPDVVCTALTRHTHTLPPLSALTRPTHTLPLPRLSALTRPTHTLPLPLPPLHWFDPRTLGFFQDFTWF